MIVYIRCPVCNIIRTGESPAEILARLTVHVAEEAGNPNHMWPTNARGNMGTLTFEIVTKNSASREKRKKYTLVDTSTTL